MRKKSTKSALLMSFTSLLLCFAMLIGCTFAWFTDSVTSGVNKIQAGNLDIEVSYKNQKNGGWNNLEGSTSVFSQDRWEPGHTEFVTLRIENKGTLALKYQMNVSPINERGGINKAGSSFKLSDSLVFGTTAASTTDPNYADRAAARAAVGATKGLTQNALTKDVKMEPGETQYITLVVYMPESVGNEANYKTGTTAPEIELGIKFIATQLGSDNDTNADGYVSYAEDDSFGKDYDKAVDYPTIDTVVTYNYFPQTNQVAQLKKSTGDNPVAQKDNQTDNHVEEANDKITIKSDAKVNNNNETPFAELVFNNNELDFTGEGDEPKATVTFKAEKKAEGNFTYSDGSDGESVTFEITASVDGGDFKANTLRTVRFFIGANKQNVTLKHVDTDMKKPGDEGYVNGAADTFVYNEADGYVTMYVSHFSEFTAAYNAPVAAVGTTAYYSVESAVAAAKATEEGGTAETVALIRDVQSATISESVPVNLNGKKVENLTVAANDVVIDDASAGKEGTVQTLKLAEGAEVDSILVGDGIKVTNAEALEEKIGYVGGSNDDYEAGIDGVKYKTLATAIKAAKTGETVTLLKDVMVNGTGVTDGSAGGAAMNINKANVTVKGNGHTITEGTGFDNGNKCSMFGIISGNVTIENLTIVGTQYLAHGINLYKATNATVKDVTVKNAIKYAVCVNASTATVDGLTAKQCGWGGINVDTGKNVTPVAGGPNAVIRNCTITDVVGGKETDCVYVEKGSATIESGTYTGVKAAEDATLTITGGTFSADPNAYVAQGCGVSEENGMYTVIGSWLNHAATSFTTPVDTTNKIVTVASAEELTLFAKDIVKYPNYTVKLTADIDLSGKIWTPISSWNGTFDGQNHTIKGMFVNADNKYGNGFFSKFGTSGTAIMKDVTFDDATVQKGSGQYSGNVYGIAAGYTAYYGNATFENVNVKNSMVWGFGKVGAIAGMSEDATGSSLTVKNCSVSDTTVKGGYNCAGFVGLVQGTMNLTGCVSSNVTFEHPSSYEYFEISASKTNKDSKDISGLYWKYDNANLFAGWSEYYNDYYNWNLYENGEESVTVDGNNYDFDGYCHNVMDSLSE